VFAGTVVVRRSSPSSSSTPSPAIVVSNIKNVLIFTTISVGVELIFACLDLIWKPLGKLVSVTQRLSAGVVLAIVIFELVPVTLSLSN